MLMKKKREIVSSDVSVNIPPFMNQGGFTESDQEAKKLSP